MFQRIKDANDRLKGHANITPIMTSRTLDQITGAQVYLKCENFQRVGAFKFRGAFNAVSQLSDQQKARGVLTFSSGNHAQAVALVGKLMGIRTTVVMPNNAPAAKRIATEAYGATVVEHDPEKTNREEVAERLQDEHGFIMIPPYDHADVIAGQGTAALEMFESVPDMDTLLVPCGGGGLLSGSAVAGKGFNPNCTIVGIEPEVADDATQSFYTGILKTVKNPPTIADGVRTPSLGKLTFPLVLEYVDEMRTVTEQAIVEAVKFLFFRMKLVVEPSGALGIAALLSRSETQSGAIGVIVSGGNIDAATLSMILQS